MLPYRIAVHGAAGRMGRRLIALGSKDPDLSIAAAVEANQHPDLGTDAGILAGIDALGIPICGELRGETDVVIDFSTPVGAENITGICLERRIPLVMATTGLDDRQLELLRKASDLIPLVQAPNMSLAVNLTMKLAEITGRTLKDHPSGADVEIIERHHRYKEDAPSGTALHFGEIIAAVMGQTHHTHGRDGRPGVRPHDEIAYHAVRTGDHPGEHAILFGLLGETIELRVGATSRDCYAQGALAAAKFLAQQSPGLYGMNNVLGLD